MDKEIEITPSMIYAAQDVILRRYFKEMDGLEIYKLTRDALRAAFDVREQSLTLLVGA